VTAPRHIMHTSTIRSLGNASIAGIIAHHAT